jgi:hypothetical protein
MRFSHDAWQQLRPLFATGTVLEFDYHGQRRTGELDTIGEGPQGAFLTIRHPDGVFKSYSLAKISGLCFGGRRLPGSAA